MVKQVPFYLTSVLDIFETNLCIWSIGEYMYITLYLYFYDIFLWGIDAMYLIALIKEY